LDEHVRVGEAGDEVEAGGRADAAEDLPVYPTHRVHVRALRHEHPGADHGVDRRARLRQCRKGHPERGTGRGADVTEGAHHTVHNARTPGGEAPWAGPHHPAVPVHVLVRAAGTVALDHGASTANASATVNAPAYSALPVITPSTPTDSNVDSARRSSSVDTPPEAITGAPVCAQTSRSSSRLGPRMVPSFMMS